MNSLVSTRFNQDTWEENKRYRVAHNINCIYGSPLEMCNRICVDSNVFVVEMNNISNKIEGIGLIRNKPYVDKYYKIYNEGNYNRYIYKSDYHISRERLLDINEDIVKIFDHILFKEKTHLKRGMGFTSIPEKLLNHSICENKNIKRVLREIFIDYFTASNENENLKYNKLNIIL
jgi:hypothetical protein